MLYRRNKSSQKDSTSELYLPSNQFTDFQDGSHCTNEDSLQLGLRLLLDVPGESLLHITSYLDPPALLSLGRVCKTLSEHIKLDNTWLRAFAAQYLGISPESDIASFEQKSLLLRKDPHHTWRDTFVSRYKLVRRWELSANSPQTHTPHSMATPGLPFVMASTQMPSHSAPWASLPVPNIVTYSILSGVVTRSYPLAAKAGNVFVIPEVVGIAHASTIAAYDGAAKGLFGYPDGKVGLLVLQKTMDHANVIRHVMPLTSSIDDSHSGPIVSIAWDDGDHKEDVGIRFGVSVSLDGMMKIWDASRNSIRCLWSSEPYHGSSYVAVKPSLLAHGLVLCGLTDGSLIVWAGLQSILPLSTRVPGSVDGGQGPQRMHIPCPLANSNMRISKVFIDPISSSSIVHILVAYQGQPNFYRISLDIGSQTTSVITFGDDPSLGYISCLEGFFAGSEGAHNGRSFVAAGDSLGYIKIYDWSSGLLNDCTPEATTMRPIRPTYKFEAHADGGNVVAIAWNNVVLVSGSELGEVKIWDGVNLAFIREFGPRKRGQSYRQGASSDTTERSSADSVGQITLLEDAQAVVFSVGDRVVGWWAGPARKHLRGGVKGRHLNGEAKKRSGRVGKTANAFDLQTAITESQDILQDSAVLPEGVLERRQNEHEQRLGLESLGLSEAEAVEYVLMLSRDNYEREEAGSSFDLPGGAEEGVFDADFDLDDNHPSPSLEVSPASAQQPPLTPSPSTSSASSRASSRRSSFHASPQSSRSISKASPSSSNMKIQVSPRAREEPKEAGPTYHGGKPIRIVGSKAAHRSKHVDHSERNFPAMPKSLSPSTPGGLTMRSLSASPNVPSSPNSKSPSAWSTPLVMTRSLGSTSSQKDIPGGQSGKGKAAQSAVKGTNDEDIDDDLRFAIELSLAEAVSRGDVSKK